MATTSSVQTPVSQASSPAQRKRGEKSRTTIHDVAKACSVSAMTVSNVINGRLGEVSPATRERILGAMQRLDYHPSAAARALSRKRTETIGIVFGIIGSDHFMTNPYASGLLQGALQAAKHCGYDVNIVTRDWINAECSTTAFKDERVDGLLLIAPSQASDIVDSLKSLKRPLVTISGDADRYGVVSVDTDDRAVGGMVVEYLLRLGHRRIAHITGNDELVSAAHRLEGYQLALSAARVPTPAEYVIHAAYSGMGAAEAVQSLMALASPPTAIFCGNDAIAFAAISTLHGLGLDVPGHVSIIGVDDAAAAALITPPLTTICQPLVETGSLAARLLVEMINGRPVPIEDHLLDPRLIERFSTRAIAQADN